MASSPNDFRDPKVTPDGSGGSSGGMGKWIAIAVAALLVLLLLGWLLGLFGGDDEAVVTGTAGSPDAVIVTTD